MAADRFTLDPSIRALLDDLHIPAGRVLRRAQLPAGLLHGGPVALAPEEYFRFWAALDAEADDPNLAVTIGQAISVEMFSPPLFAALCSPNLDVAARRIATYKPLIGPMRVDLTQEAAGLTVTYRWPAGMTPPQLLGTTELAFWVALARIATRHHVRPARATAPQLPPDPDTAAEYFGVHIRKGPTWSISFAAGDATRPFLTESEPMWRFFAPELRRRLADLQAAASTAERVHAALLETLPAGDHTMATVAHHLATSPRTLQRQLQAEGTTFQAVLTGTREHLARHYLTHSAMTTADIAYLLAYDDTNSFYRAFRTWTGSTPDTLRTAATSAAAAAAGVGQ
ncbi:MAG TPA: AraC family transcriptional regulator ligand-binding domain-containing protein [Streptosporangiaceae bacterium]|jgi:AraC-like DNA-binding protein